MSLINQINEQELSLHQQLVVEAWVMRLTSLSYLRLCLKLIFLLIKLMVGLKKVMIELIIFLLIFSVLKLAKHGKAIELQLFFILMLS